MAELVFAPGRGVTSSTATEVGAGMLIDPPFIAAANMVGLAGMNWRVSFSAVIRTYAPRVTHLKGFVLWSVLGLGLQLRPGAAKPVSEDSAENAEVLAKNPGCSQEKHDPDTNTRID